MRLAVEPIALDVEGDEGAGVYEDAFFFRP